MPQLHETGYGRKFFDSQMPALIRAIERLAKAIEESNKKPPETPKKDD